MWKFEEDSFGRESQHRPGLTGASIHPDILGSYLVSSQLLITLFHRLGRFQRKEVCFGSLFWSKVERP
jgi:hypothetical protein